MTTAFPMIRINPTTPTAMHRTVDTLMGLTDRPTTYWAALAISAASVEELVAVTMKLKIMKRITHEGITTSIHLDTQVHMRRLYIDNIRE